jgi:hypothetical protein
MFADEARFGRMNRPRPCRAPLGVRPKVASQLIREYIYLYGAVSPQDGTCIYLIMPTSDRVRFKVMRRFAYRQRVGKWRRLHSASGHYWRFLRRSLKFPCRFASIAITVENSEGNFKEAA